MSLLSGHSHLSCLKRAQRKVDKCHLALSVNAILIEDHPTGCATSCREDVNRLHERVQSSRFLGGPGEEFSHCQTHTMV